MNMKDGEGDEFIQLSQDTIRSIIAFTSSSQYLDVSDLCSENSLLSESSTTTTAPAAAASSSVSTKRRKVRKVYTSKEDEIIRDYVKSYDDEESDEYMSPNGRRLWRQMEEEKLLPGRSWQSIREHYLGFLAPSGPKRERMDLTMKAKKRRIYEMMTQQQNASAIST